VVAPNETRDVWRLYLEKGNFEEALKYTKDDASRDKVLLAHADKLFAMKKFNEAARLLADSTASFEESCLRFIQTGETEALIAFLLFKFDKLASKDKMQLAMLCVWLVELYLHSLDSLRDAKEGESGQIGIKSPEYLKLQGEFRNFLSMQSVMKNLDQRTAYDLIASHGNLDDLMYYASLIEDYERVIQHHIRLGAYSMALKVLDGQQRLELYYRFTPILMQHMPRETVDACLRRRDLEPRQLIPAFIRYQQKREFGASSENEAVRYLKHCIESYQNTDPAIHNYLISLFAKMPTDVELLNFLNTQSGHPVYDQKYVFRLCTQEKQMRACVLIYSGMGLYQEAVELALTVDLNLAIANAKIPEKDAELSKKLWLRIAKHVVAQEKKDIKKAMAILHECSLLKIEDILPFFPDFVTIDHFQDEISKSLSDYSSDIGQLKHNMESATRSAEQIHGDIQELRSKYGEIVGNAVCGVCSYPLLTRHFYLFPCKHAYHADCLIEQLVKHLTPAQQRRVRNLQSQIAKAMQGLDVGKSVTDLKAELDEIAAEDCIACGEIIIKLIDEPFVPSDKMDDYLASWNLSGVNRF
jgi:hypothetical protein